ncbi:MAG: SpoVG family protein [Alphaproteobacteria bacterium]|nr:SpoVG family protein [Alphaproteobacteria bacterium]
MSNKNGETPELATKVRVYHAEGKGKADLLGFADLVIGGAFVIKSIRILRVNPEKAGGEVCAPFISFPSRRSGRSEEEMRYVDVAHPITSEAYHAAAKLILDHYRQAAANAPQ